MRASAAADVLEVGGTGSSAFVILVGGTVLLACAIAVLSVLFAVVRGLLDDLVGLGAGPFLVVFGVAGTVAWFVTSAATGNATAALVVAVVGGLAVTFVVSLLVD